MSSGSCISRHDCWMSWEDEDGEDVPILNFSDDLISRLGWDEGDELIWEANDDGSVCVRKNE